MPKPKKEPTFATVAIVVVKRPTYLLSVFPVSSVVTICVICAICG